MRLTLIFAESAFSYNLPLEALEVRVDLVLCLVLLGLVLVIGALNSFNNICIKTNSANFNSRHTVVGPFFFFFYVFCGFFSFSHFFFFVGKDHCVVCSCSEWSCEGSGNVDCSKRSSGHSREGEIYCLSV